MLTSCYPVLATDDVATARAFWTGPLGFEIVFDAGWYVSLSREGHELALLHRDHPTIPADFRGRSATGVLVNLEVDDVDAEWDRLAVRAGLPVALELRDEDFGQRHFILAGPDGVLVDVITEIPPSAEFAAAFTGTATD
ncbi:Glyoxalase/Bleomycin resistance protein/dioxygenase domain [Pseudonocardia sp. Ae168_Ps1]|uniref:VOC family protein n=1 Tax=unclassified Pseudonocardia TaxID=2619320 RepID=UPI0001FFE594|nr:MULTISPECIES: VOC family protein [unclassified Pseudonocardia]OLL75867.1 Glyoxalase/Bleomycin resistance protein/dioxygenase domain [Pseudonocardia sp. Ae150A_Ps1]OLL81865.1 Glyoxalase/Bleomycin resistance protein/dioxygenase domain [Pseudonocardia sp. Ae168_Ps1]OLL84023.1 Glyoxalase/Bleomycin resistance protein/dioxygenase domain [Pseudonocardia sp. Ae263_Ps1]OLL95958.1 Glyoxalase/Bleomycin resistance protein/dioxygenase domain [Pseudonocardia sp. Ae356_Ps1]OLM16649.1 Glyoxalase/Bleomycin 